MYLRKDTVVRITDPSWNLIGETFRVTGKKRTLKGVVQMELQSLETHNRTTFAMPEQVTPSVELTPEQHEQLTRRQVEIKEQSEQARKDREAKDIASRLAKLDERNAEDVVWSEAQPFEQAAQRHAYDRHLSTEVWVMGPQREVAGVIYDNELRVTVDVRKGSFELPRDYTSRSVNWSAIGARSPAVARAYARAILAAADLAEQLEVPAEQLEVPAEEETA